MLCKEEWLARTSRINYWNTDKPVCFVLSYVLFITQQYKQKKQHKKYLCNPSSHYGKYGEYAREMCTPYLDT